jgi:hypothetical protein
MAVELDVWLRFAQSVRRPDRLPPESVEPSLDRFPPPVGQCADDRRVEGIPSYAFDQHFELSTLDFDGIGTVTTQKLAHATDNILPAIDE